MSQRKPVDRQRLSAREKAVRAAENHWPDATRRHILITLARLIQNDDCLVYPSAKWLAWRTGLGETSIETAFAEFRRHGILRPTGETIGQGGTNVYRFEIDRLSVAYPLPEPWEEVAARNKVKRENRKKSNANVPRVAGNVAIANGVNAPRVSGNESRMNGESFPVCRVNVPRDDAQRSPRAGSTFPACRGQGFKEGLKQGYESGSLSRRDGCALSRTDAATGERENAARKSGDIGTVARLLVSAFFKAGGEARTRGEVDVQCRNLVIQGATVSDMREAITSVKATAKQPDRPPRWPSVHNALHVIVRARASVIDPSTHKGGAQTLNAARKLEAVFERYVDKPGWNALRTRWDMGNWLTVVVTRGIDEATFEAACVDAKAQSNGKLPTWRTVRDALDARIKAHKQGMQKRDQAKLFFEPPAATAGYFIAQGNDTRH